MPDKDKIQEVLDAEFKPKEIRVTVYPDRVEMYFDPRLAQYEVLGLYAVLGETINKYVTVRKRDEQVENLGESTG